MPDKYITVDEVAKMMGVSRMTVYRLVHSKDLEAYRIGPKLIRIPESAVTSYMSRPIN